MSSVPTLRHARLTQRHITKLLLRAFVCATLPLQIASAQAAEVADSARVAIEQAFAAGQPETIAVARAIAERGLQRHPGDAMLLHYQAYGLYREATVRDKNAARPLLEQARSVMERSIAIRDLPESRVILASVLGNLIGGSPWRAMRLGRASFAEADRARALGPENPRAWMLSGVGYLFAPSIFGGGAGKAESALRKAIALFAGDHPERPLPAWGRAEAHGWLAIALARQDKGAEARRELAHALELEPQHAFLLRRVQATVDSADTARAP